MTDEPKLPSLLSSIDPLSFFFGLFIGIGVFTAVFAILVYVIN